jgi:hypothetical protein
MSLKNPVTPLGIDPGTVRLVAQRLNHYAENKRHGRKISKNGQGEQKLWLKKSEQIFRRSY